MSNPYVIFVGHKADDMQPFDSAPTEKAAVNRAAELKEVFPCVEAIYMPEDDLDINEIIYEVIYS